MLGTSTHHIQENDNEVMRDKRTLMRSIWRMAEHKGMMHDTMSSSDLTLAWPTWPILTLAYKTAKTGIEKHELQI